MSEFVGSEKRVGLHYSAIPNTGHWQASSWAQFIAEFSPKSSGTAKVGLDSVLDLVRRAE